MGTTNFPGASDTGLTLPTPTSLDTLASIQSLMAHSELHADEIAAILAMQAKIGFSAAVPVDVPVANGVLASDAFGKTLWTSTLTLTSVTGALLGNASTATKLATARTINGVSFDGSANISSSSFISALGSDVALNNAGSFFDVVSVSQGAAGNWIVGVNVTLIDTAGAAGFAFKVWDGTTIFASGQFNTTAATTPILASFMVLITSPAANIRLSVRDLSSISGSVKANQSGGGKDTVLSVVRVG